ncbi:MAG TPA: DUF411 domain-containing protein [Steroidobacteraceae bacterium]|nr:DUF411 domain-containing protein [Steroidobacteraceae bacterium]
MLLTIAILVGISVWTILNVLAPRSMPMVTVYASPDCASCLRWMQHIAARGFRTQLGPESDWPAVRAQLALTPEFRSSLTAVVEGGLLIEGPVPARDIHRALTLRSSYDVRGLVVRGVPRGSPGTDPVMPEPYTVLVVRGGGRIQPFAVHEPF